MIKYFLTHYWRTILISIVIFAISTYNFSGVTQVLKFQNNDKFIHLMMYLGLGFVVFWEFAKSHESLKESRGKLLAIFLIFAAFGGIIEVIQGAFFYPRTAEFADWFADIIGFAAGLGIGSCGVKLYRKYKKK